MKKFLNPLLLISLIFSTMIIVTNPVVATNIEEDPTISIKEIYLSEFEALLRDIEACESKMMLLSTHADDYKRYSELINYKENYINFLYEQKELTYDQLLEQNYTNRQIEALKRFDGSDVLAVQASASVAVSGATMSATSTKHGVRFSWNWLGTPFFSGPGIEDGVAVRWQSTNSSAVLIHTVKHSDSNVFVRYGSTKSNVNITYFASSRGAEAKFRMTGTDGSEANWASSGVFDIYVTLPSGTSTTISHTSYEFVYAHTTLGLNLSVSFSYPGSTGVGISVVQGSLEYRKNWETYL